MISNLGIMGIPRIFAGSKLRGIPRRETRRYLTTSLKWGFGTGIRFGYMSLKMYSMNPYCDKYRILHLHCLKMLRRFKEKRILFHKKLSRKNRYPSNYEL